MTNHSERVKVEDEAADWAVLLVDDPEDAEQWRQFNLWLNSSPLHAEVWARTRRAYDGLEQLSPVTLAQWPTASPDDRPGTLSQVLEGKRRTGRSPARLVNWSKSLAGVALAACLMLVFLPHLTLQLSADYISGTGEQQTHVLDDGSKLYLAPESAVDITYSDGERFVSLLQGAAFFEVQPDTERPFSVEAGGTRTTVLGTAFDVNKSGIGATVSVARGHVRVEDRSVSPMVSENLSAGDALAVIWGKSASLTHVAPDDIAHWRRGELIARNLPVGELVESFRRYYRGVILVTEPFASQRVTGLYRLSDPVSTLTDMAQAHGASAHQISSRLLVLSQ